MTNLKKLKRCKQCTKCPWKVTTNPYDIPRYSRTGHGNLGETISDGVYRGSDEIIAMACHDSAVGEEYYCVGWLMNQLGSGNNIALRLKMLKYDLSDVELVGEQHQYWEETLKGEE